MFHRAATPTAPQQLVHSDTFIPSIQEEACSLLLFFMVDELMSRGGVPTLFSFVTAWSERMCSSVSAGGGGSTGLALPLKSLDYAIMTAQGGHIDAIKINRSRNEFSPIHHFQAFSSLSLLKLYFTVLMFFIRWPLKKE